MSLLQSIIPWACKKGIKSNAGAKSAAKKKNTSPPNEWGNIPFGLKCKSKSVSIYEPF